MSQKKIRSQTQECKAQETAHTIGDRIRELRDKRHLTQGGAAMKFYMDKSVWSRIESDKQPPTVQFVEEMCKEWGVTADYLIFGDVDRASEHMIDVSGISQRDRNALETLIESLRCR